MNKDFSKLIGNILESKLEELQAAPEEFKDCDKIYKTNLGKDGLPLFLGIQKDEGTLNYRIALGNSSNIIDLDINQFGYLITGLNTLLFKVQKDINNTEPDIAVAKIDKFIQDNGGITVSEGVNVVDSNQDLKDLISGKSGEVTSKPSGRIDQLKEMLEKLAEKTEKKEKKLEDLENEDAIIDEKMSKELESMQEEISNFKKDMEKIYEDMTPEERRQYNRELQIKEEELQAKKMKEFERSLLGDIKTEEDITYTYAHFKKILDEQGQEAFREELAKIPKEQREEIIKRVVKEYQQSKHKTEDIEEEKECREF